MVIRRMELTGSLRFMARDDKHRRRPSREYILGSPVEAAGSFAAVEVVEQLGRSATFRKIGLQRLAWAGPDVVREPVAQGKRVFLNQTLFEIPRSVAVFAAIIDEVAGAERS